MIRSSAASPFLYTTVSSVVQTSRAMLATNGSIQRRAAQRAVRCNRLLARHSLRFLPKVLPLLIVVRENRLVLIERLCNCDVLVFLEVFTSLKKLQLGL